MLERETVSCHCGVSVGSPAASVSLPGLLRSHDAVVLATGLSRPKNLLANRNNLRNYFSSAEFVAWYNSDPHVGSPDVDLGSVKRAAIIGHGNVALDIARMLLRPWWSYANTAIGSGALRELQRSAVETVDLIGRRGPLQVPLCAMGPQSDQQPRCPLREPSSRKCLLCRESPLEPTWMSSTPSCRNTMRC